MKDRVLMKLGLGFEVCGERRKKVRRSRREIERRRRRGLGEKSFVGRSRFQALAIEIGREIQRQTHTHTETERREFSRKFLKTGS